MAQLIAAGTGKQDVEAVRARSEELRSALKESRRRCASLGMDRHVSVLPPATSKDREIARKNVIGSIAYTRKINLGYLRSLDKVIGQLGGAILYLDHSLHVCGLRGDQQQLEKLASKNIAFGTSFSEESAGTNAASLTRDLMCGCVLAAGENYCDALNEYVCFAQGPIKMGVDDFIIALAVVPAAGLEDKEIDFVEHAFYTLGIISGKNEMLHSAASGALLDRLMARRGLSFVIVDEHERIVQISHSFLEALHLQGRTTVGARMGECIPELSPVLDVCRRTPGEPGEIKLEGLTLGGFPAWAIGIPLSVEGMALLGIAVKSAVFREHEGNDADELEIEGFAGESSTAATLRSRMEAIARRDDALLIIGEHGSGKGAAARAIHRASARGHCPFIACECMLLTEEHGERMLFGFPEGPGLFEQAKGGTLLLEGIENMPRNLQALLGRVLETGTLTIPGTVELERNTVRLMLTASRNVHELAHEGILDKDFCYRMPAVVLTLPALRDHPEDIPVIARNLIGRRMGTSLSEVRIPSTQELHRLSAFSWPGNIRELKNAIDRAIAELEIAGRPLGDLAGTIECESDQAAIASEPAANQLAGKAVPVDEFVSSYRTLEQRELVCALSAHHGNKTAAAQALGITRKTLYARLRKYGLID